MLRDSLSALIAQGYLQVTSNGAAIDKGPLYRIGEIQVRGLPGFHPAQLGLASMAGLPATAANLGMISNQIRKFLLDNGQPFAVIALDFSTPAERLAQAGRSAPSKPEVDLSVDIAPGDGYKYGGFKFSGSRTQPDVLERMSLLRYGETFSEARMAQALERLSRTGYFEAVIPGTMLRDGSKNLLYPTLAVTDLKGNRLSGILGYDSQKKGSSGVNGYMDIHLINLRGTARDLDFTFDSKQSGQGTEEKDAHLAYTEPWILSTPVGAKIDLQVSLQDSIYDERSGELTLFRDLDFRSRYFVAFAQQYNRDYLAQTQTSAVIAGIGLSYDGRDRVPSTLKGVKVSTRVNGLRRDLSDSSYYLVQSINEVALWANHGRWVAHALLSASGNWPLEGRNNRGELYALGGANTIRGYREKEFLTNLFAYGNFELQFLLAPRSRASIFIVPGFINRLDAAANSQGGEFLNGDVYWRRVLGYGIGLESGAKDWTFGVSYALNPDRNIGDGFIHMSVINNF